MILTFVLLFSYGRQIMKKNEKGPFQKWKSLEEQTAF